MPYDPQLPLERNKLASALERMLKESKFELDPRTKQERVFSRAVTDDVRVVVYSSIVGTEVRTYGSDAIRILTLAEGGYPIAKEHRVFRVGEIESIVQRTLVRMRAAWVKGKNVPRCKRCNAPLFVTKKNKRACSKLCWKST